MSQENVAIVRELQPSGVDLAAAVDANQEPFPEVDAAWFADDFASSFIAPGLPSEVRHGIVGFMEGWRDWLEAWQRYEIWTEEFIDAGDDVVVFARVNALTRRDAIEMGHAPAAVWTLRGGIVQRIDFYYERSEALKAVGLEE